MSDVTPIRIASISNNPNLSWVWLRDLIPDDFSVAGRPLVWSGFSAAPERTFTSKRGISIARRFNSFARARASSSLAITARMQSFDVAVSHGPLQAAWTELFLRYYGAKAKHFAFAFNFTNLPTGGRRMLMTKAFKTVDEFAVFTKAEQSHYPEYFNINPNKFVLAPWGVSPPLRSAPKKTIEGNYFAALGGEARDYSTLCEVAKLSPDTHFVAIARPHNFQGLEVPNNLTVHFNLPRKEAWAIVWHADAMIVPMLARETPCGIVTVVGSMHLGKAQIVTNSVGITDFIEHERTGLTVPAKDPLAIANAVKILQNDHELRNRLGHAATKFATRHCSEATTVNFFQERLKSWFC